MHKLYRITALAETVVLVVTMGACSRKIEVSNTTTVSENKSVVTTLENTTVPTTFSIFDEIEEETEVEITVPETTEATTEKEKYPEIAVESRFSTQQELEEFLRLTYANSGKSIWQIIEEIKKEQEEGYYYAFRSDLLASAAYALITEKGYTLDDLALELDYLLTLIMNPREMGENDHKVLKPLFDLLEKDGSYAMNVFQFFESLALERHRVACPEKDNHTKGHKLVACPTLDEEKLYKELMGMVLALTSVN